MRAITHIIRKENPGSGSSRAGAKRIGNDVLLQRFDGGKQVI
jgi:hypothetical protein